MKLADKLKAYYFTAVLSLLFAMVGFSYNAWRMEVSEDNNNIRTAAFEVLKELAELERVIYAAHYDQDAIEGNPRKGWVKVGLITDLSPLIGPDVQTKAMKLKAGWAENWSFIHSDQQVTSDLVATIDSVRKEIRRALEGLR